MNALASDHHYAKEAWLHSLPERERGIKLFINS